MKNPMQSVRNVMARLLGTVEDSRNRLEAIEQSAAAQRLEMRELLDQNAALLTSSRLLQQTVAESSLDLLVETAGRQRDKRYLGAAPGQVYSQNNEDGIISEIFQRIGTQSRTFLEIAAGDGIENTTRLLADLGWTGLWVEAGDAEAACIRDVMAGPIADGRLVYLQQKVDRDNVMGLVPEAMKAGLDYLSLDIDYNTSHIWSALAALKPRLVCIEYNAHFPPAVDYEVPYDPQGSWAGTTRFGASLKALERIGRGLGFSLVGCDIFGVNAFFVRNDLCGEEKFLAPFTAETHYEPPRYSAVHMRGHARHTHFQGGSPA